MGSGYETFLARMGSLAGAFRAKFGSSRLSIAGMTSIMSALDLSSLSVVPDEDIIHSMRPSTSTVHVDSIAAIIGARAFQRYSNLRAVSLPNARIVRTLAFGYCMSLSSLYLPRVEAFGADAMWACTSLSTLDLRSVPHVPYVEYTNGTGDPYYSFLYQTAIHSGTGSIIVPASLYTSFRTDRAWGQYASLMVSV